MLFDMINDYNDCYIGGADDVYLESILDGSFDDSDEEVVRYIYKHLVNMLDYIKKIECDFDGYMKAEKVNILNFVDKYADVFLKIVEV